MSQASNSEENIRNNVSECVGRLFTSNPEEMQFQVMDGLGVKSAAATFARSIKFSGVNADENHAEIVGELA